MIRWQRVVLCGVLVCGCSREVGLDQEAPEVSASRPPGVVVAEVQPGTAGTFAGLAPGDLLTVWAALDGRSAGDLADPFAYQAAHDAESLRGKVRLSGWRGSEPLDVTLGPGGWGLQVRPDLPAETLSAYVAAQEDPAPGSDPMAALHHHAESLGESEPAAAAWLHAEIGSLAAKARDWDAAEASFQAAAELAARWALPERAQAQILAREATVLGDGRQVEAALAAQRRAVELVENSAPDGLTLAYYLSRLARWSMGFGRFDDAEPLLERALDLRREAAPRSFAVAKSLASLGTLDAIRGRVEEARDAIEQARRILAEQAPVSPEMAWCLSNLGLLAKRRGELASAQELLEASLAASTDPTSTATMGALNNLGIIARQRGRLDQAEAFWRRSHAINLEKIPHSLETAGTGSNLGRLATYQGDFDRAVEILGKAVRIFAESAPGSLGHIQALLALGDAQEGRGELEAAGERYREALAATAGQGEGSTVRVAAALAIGELLRRQERWQEAEEHLTQVRDVLGRLAPGGLHEAEVLFSLGRLAGDRGDVETARRWHQEALAIRSELAPGSAAQADSLGALARLARRRGDVDAAIELYHQALAAVESQLRFLGGTEEIRTRFAQRFAPLYQELFGLLLEQGRGEEAFEVSERYRAQSFVALLAERDLELEPDRKERPAGERQRLKHLYEQNRQALDRLGPVPGDHPELVRLLAERRALAVERQQTWEAGAGTVPRRAEQPAAPMTVDDVARALPAGSVLVSFVVGAEATDAQVVRRDRDGGRTLAASTLPVSAEELAERVAAFRRLLYSADPSTSRPEAVRELGAGLYQWLLEPVAPSLAAADELLILPDGPLHSLPFAALTVSGEAGASRRPPFLVEHVAVRVAESARVLARWEPASPAKPAGEITLAAFGDPWLEPAAVEPVAEASEMPTPSARMTRGSSLGPLPYARLEVERIAGLFPGSEARVGREATEARVKQLSEGLDVVHFACHSVIDERFPLDSFLALAPDPTVSGPGDDGQLQAWEIFEEVRLDADLVTLSACDTGLSGEGLVGLTQAFHYAGAEAVLASLWQVSDRSSADLMVRFYQHLQAGLEPAQALRSAQLALLAGLEVDEPRRGLRGLLDRLWGGRRASPDAGAVDTAHPYHWAAFQLYSASAARRGEERYQ